MTDFVQQARRTLGICSDEAVAMFTVIATRAGGHDVIDAEDVEAVASILELMGQGGTQL